jgi:hypothetical protein
MTRLWVTDFGLAHVYHGEARLTGTGRTALVQRAAKWVRRHQSGTAASAAGSAIAQQMQHWLRDDDFAVVRGDNVLAKLPAEERSAWRKLWADVAGLLILVAGPFVFYGDAELLERIRVVLEPSAPANAP